MSEQNLIVDLYELTMAAGYFQQNYNPTVTFELFIRDLPDKRNFLVTAGQQQAVEFLTDLHFTKEQVDYLRSLPNFKNITADFFDYLLNFRFSGDLYGLPEGTIIFANEPVLQVVAPLIEAQIVETFLLSSINFQTMVASKAVRVVHAATSDGRERGVMEFGSRRAHGPQAGELAARAAYLAGFMGTSNVLAGYKYHIPVLGTTAHSWTMAFENELQAFQKYHDIFKNDSVFLIDTYDTEQGVKNAMSVAPKFSAVRIDSGNLSTRAKRIRKMLDESGYNDVKIILSSDLNEFKIADLIRQGTPVDSFGVGTQVVTSFDAPTLQGVYKMVAIDKKGRIAYRAKFSSRKVTLPGRKQIWRFFDSNGKMLHDLLALHQEDFTQSAEPLLRNLVKNGKQTSPFPSLPEIREQLKRDLQSLPVEMHDLQKSCPYSIRFSEELNELFTMIKAKLPNGNGD